MRDGVPSTEFGGRPRVFDYDFEGQIFTEVTDCMTKEPPLISDRRPSSDEAALDHALPAARYKAWRRLAFRIVHRTTIVPK
jgi:hypothetical protein